MLAPPQNEDELLMRCAGIEGLSIAQLSSSLGIRIPEHINQRKGFIGQAVELALGASAGSKSLPDFLEIDVELKTLPLDHLARPSESTFITTIPLLRVHEQNWANSQCRSKIKRILWVTVEGDTTIPLSQRRLGHSFLWSPSVDDEKILQQDWSELTSMISRGELAKIDARMGEYLQVRPKAAHGKSLCYGLDEAGSKILTLPRGFYLRSTFTASILSKLMAN